MSEVPLYTPIPNPEPSNAEGMRPGGEFLIDNLLIRIRLIIEMISVDRPCAVGV
jgi:hypothetical protein